MANNFKHFSWSRAEDASLEVRCLPTSSQLNQASRALCTCLPHSVALQKKRPSSVFALTWFVGLVGLLGLPGLFGPRADVTTVA